MWSYTIKSSWPDRVPIPSHFSPNGWKFVAFDNEDFEDNSSISGTQKHHKYYIRKPLHHPTSNHLCPAQIYLNICNPEKKKTFLSDYATIL